jgi:hypothetical protein
VIETLGSHVDSIKDAILLLEPVQDGEICCTIFLGVFNDKVVGQGNQSGFGKASQNAGSKTVKNRAIVLNQTV